MSIQEFLSRFEKPRKTNNGWEVRCPSHDDRKPSLTISEGNDGRILLCCQSNGCSAAQICDAMGIGSADLFLQKPQRNGEAKRIVATYDYQDADGKLIFQVVRYWPKSFKQRKPHPQNPGAWIWQMAGVNRVLFRLPEITREIQRGLPIFICEGEKDVLEMVKHGLSATCNPGGAGKWQSSYSKTLNGADVIIVADKDLAGRNHAQLVAAQLSGIVKRLRCIELPDENGKAIKDAADFFAAGGDANRLNELVNQSEVWTRQTAPGPHLVDQISNNFPAVTAWIRGKIIESMLDTETPAAVKNGGVAANVVTALTRIGRFYFHSELRDFDSAMFFDANRKRLERIGSDSFAAWLADWIVVNRASGLFRFVLSAVETAALSGADTTGILPESYWAARPDALYLSNGDGALVRITGRSVTMCDNGTDGILFAAGNTLASWKLTTPQDPFETCSLFRNAHCGASHGKDLLRLWSYSFPTMPRSKPPLGVIGEIGSGKTRTLKGVAELYGIPFRAAKVEEQLEPNFWPNVNQGGLFVLDNADSKCRWLADAVAAAATDGCSQRRKLYTNSETVILRANAWLAITSANPTFGNDAGLADRLLIIRMERRGEETNDSAFTDEILANRDAGLSHIAATLQKALGDTGPTPACLNARHPDFAGFAVKIGRALDREAEAINALQNAEADKSAFCLENDSIAAALISYLHGGETFIGTAAELVPKLCAVDAEFQDRLSAKRLSKRLIALWPHLQKCLAIARKEQDRKGFTVFTLKAKPAEFAEIQTDFS